MEECPRCHYFSVYYSVEKGKKRCFMPNCLWEEGQPADGPVVKKCCVICGGS